MSEIKDKLVGIAHKATRSKAHVSKHRPADFDPELFNIAAGIELQNAGCELPKVITELLVSENQFDRAVALHLAGEWVSCEVDIGLNILEALKSESLSSALLLDYPRLLEKFRKAEAIPYLIKLCERLIISDLNLSTLRRFVEALFALSPISSEVFIKEVVLRDSAIKNKSFYSSTCVFLSNIAIGEGQISLRVALKYLVDLPQETKDYVLNEYASVVERIKKFKPEYNDFKENIEVVQILRCDQ